MLNIKHFRELVVKPTLFNIGMYSLAAENLIIGTATQESRLFHLKQKGDGPALGVMQMEPATHKDIWDYLDRKPVIAQSVRELAASAYRGTNIPPSEMIGNLNYAVAMARVLYWRRPEPMPAHDDLNGLARYYKRFYNTHLGAATVDEFVGNYPK